MKNDIANYATLVKEPAQRRDNAGNLPEKRQQNPAKSLQTYAKPYRKCLNSYTKPRENCVNDNCIHTRTTSPAYSRCIIHLPRKIIQSQNKAYIFYYLEVNLLMSRRFIDTGVYASRKMAKDGNIDHGYWFDKSIAERLAAAVRMIEVAFQEPGFLQKKVDRSAISARKQIN